MKNDKGFTLVEIVVTLAIVGVLFLTMANFMGFGIKTHKISANEANVQSTIRLLSSNINSSVRNSSATFLLHKPTNRDLAQSDLTDGWNYITISKGGKSVLKYEWDSKQSKHIVSTIMSEVPGTTFELEYKKDSSNDNVVEYNIIANVNGIKRTLNSELEGLNSLQVIDRKPVHFASNTLAYRFGNRDAAFSETQAAVAMVLDQSGSMAYDMNGKSTSNINNQRITKLKNEATRLVEELQENPNVYISLNPFSSTANNSEPMTQAILNKEKDKPITKSISIMVANGGTNTGDGMRRAYYRIKEFNEENEKKTNPKTTNNFMIILVDGGTSYRSIQKVKNSTKVQTYTGNDNINISTKVSSYSSLSNGVTGYDGPGNKISPEVTAYVDEIGEMMREYDNKMKVYVIGFSNVGNDHASLDDIAKATNGKKYVAGSEEVLKEIFAEIKREINESLWYIGGPN